MTKSKPFCYAPWTTVQYQGTQGIKPCCEWKGPAFKGNVKDYHNSKYLSKIKTAMKTHDTDIISKNCIECIETEDLGDKSTRGYIKRDVDSKRYTAGQLGKLDYRPDNLCNLKCRMCGPNSSSLIEEEYITPKVQQKATELHFNTGIKSPILVRDTDDVLDFDLSNLKTLAILGGEPTVNKKVFPILDYLIDNGMNKNIRLQYTTNCTSINRPWMSRIEKFKDVNVNLSIDAAGKAYEYIRTGAEWNKVEKNIPKIIDIAEDYSIQMVVQTTSFAIIEDWIEYFLQFPTDTINMTPMYGVAGKLDCIPDHIKADKIKYLEKLNHPTADMAINHLKRYPYNPDQARMFKKRTMFLDNIRGTSIYDLDPIFEEIVIKV
tara:strand:+ start:11830 stop:12957 length:1128 start_codon:yes stop_codon:yes gene_type:complete